MQRYLALYLNFVRFSCSQALLFRFDFWFRIVMDLVFYGVMLGFYHTLFLHTEVLGNFNREQALVFIGAFAFLDALQMTIFANGTWALSNLVKSGELDYYLLRPVSTLFFVSLRDFSLSSLINLLFATGILAWALHAYSGDISFWQYLYGFFLILNGVFLFYIFRVLSQIPSFWIISGSGLQTAFYILREVGERPDGLFKGLSRFVFMTILPFCLMSSLPTRAFFEPFSPMMLLHILAVTVLSFMIMLWAWRRALHAYASASS
jgi:ABC-2 type transport system permease protein